MDKRILSLLSMVLAVMSIANVNAVEQGATRPDCLLKAFNGGQTYPLKSLQGKVLYIDFWASWCGPCAKSFPFLNSLHSDLNARGLQIVGINLDENASDAHGFLAKYPANFSISADNNEQCAQAFGVKAMPSSYLIDRKGIVRKVHLGFRADEAEELKVLVEKLLAEQ
jgi:peroxiredoxin